MIGRLDSYYRLATTDARKRSEFVIITLLNSASYTGHVYLLCDSGVKKQPEYYTGKIFWVAKHCSSVTGHRMIATINLLACIEPAYYTPEYFRDKKLYC